MNPQWNGFFLVAFAIVSAVLYAGCARLYSAIKLRQERKHQEFLMDEFRDGRSFAEDVVFDQEYPDDWTWTQVMHWAQGMVDLIDHQHRPEYCRGFEGYLAEVEDDITKAILIGQEMMILDGGPWDAPRRQVRRVSQPADVQTFAQQQEPQQRIVPRGPRIPRSMRSKDV